MSTVYVVQEALKKDPNSGVLVPRINYNTLKPYGQIKFLFQWSDHHREPPTSQLLDTLRTGLINFSDEDFLAPLGNPALIGMAVAVAAEINDGRVRILDWNRNTGRYRVIDFDLDAQPFYQG